MEKMTKKNRIKIFKRENENDDQNHARKRWQRDMTVKINNGEDEKEKHDKNQ
jgi:hypothetical protein